MFGKEQIITSEFPNHFLDYQGKRVSSFRWTDRVQTQSGGWTGNIFPLFQIVYKKLVSDFTIPFMTKGPYRVGETRKHLAVREAFANCLVNADFFQAWSVVIEKFPDRIIISNPDTIIPGGKSKCSRETSSNQGTRTC